jgi:hypothetical protein
MDFRPLASWLRLRDIGPRLPARLTTTLPLFPLARLGQLDFPRRCFRLSTLAICSSALSRAKIAPSISTSAVFFASSGAQVKAFRGPRFQLVARPMLAPCRWSSAEPALQALVHHRVAIRNEGRARLLR